MRQYAAVLEAAAIGFSLCDQNQQATLVQVVQELQQITPLGDSLIQAIPVAQQEQPKPEEVKFIPEIAKAKIEETGEVLGQDGNKIEGLSIEKIPTNKELNDLFIKINSDPRLATYFVDALKKNIAKFKELYQA